VEAVGGEGHGGELFVGDLDAGGVVALIETGVDLEAGAGGGVGDQVDDDLVAGEGPASPVDGDGGEQSVLDLG